MSQEHPFAQYVRILGKGRQGSRGLTEEEAYITMRMILAGEVEPIQLGAFLMLMRVKEETGPEVAGAVRAIRETIDLPQLARPVELDWSSYAGKRRQLPWFILTNLLLAANGVRIFMHGTTGHTPGRIYTEDALRALGLPVCEEKGQVAAELERCNFAYMPLAAMVPRLQEIIEYRPLLGLRSPVHTVGRLINPFEAPYSAQSIFHRGYMTIHQDGSELLGQPNMVVIKGEGGEVERNPDMVCEARTLHAGQAGEEEWPPLFEKRHVHDESLDLNQLRAVWEGEMSHEYGEAAVVGTAAIVLKLMDKASDQASAEQAARELWAARDKRWPA